jgi:hypothetical protein
MLFKMKFKWIIAVVTLLCISFSFKPVMAIGSIGHFDDTSWGGLSGSFDSIEVDIRVDVWNGGADAYFYSNTAYFRSGATAYGGLQTNGYDGTRWVGKMAIFSIWNATSGIADPGGTGSSFDELGTGYSVRMPYDWQAGSTYRFRIYIDQDATSGNRLWAGSVTNLNSGQTKRIGRIYVPVTFGKLQNPVSFHERYIGGTDNCSQISPSQVSFMNMTANNGTVRFSSLNHYVKKVLPECPALVWVQDLSNGYTSGVATAQPVISVAPATPSKPVPQLQAPKIQEQPILQKGMENTDQKIPDKIHDISTPVSAISKKGQNNLIPVIIVIFSGVGVIGGLWLRLKFKQRRLLKRLSKHFPYDFDIHGHRT